MMKRWKKALAIILGALGILALFALWMFSPRLLSINYKGAEGANEGVWNDVSAADWMGHIAGETPLSSISLPGSHDSATRYVELPLIASCQNTTISQQLNDGVRVLDIRLNYDGGELTLSHGFLNCKTGPYVMAENLSFSEILDECEDFLLEHDTETILMMVKHEHGDAVAQEVEDAVLNCIGDRLNMFYTENSVPSLDEVRGKIVFARRYGEAGDKSLMGLDFYWDDQGGNGVYPSPFQSYDMTGDVSLLVQDRYEYDTGDKIAAVSAGIDNPNEDEAVLSLNYLSTKGDGAVGIPKLYAQVINAWFMAKDLRSGTDYGCIIFDFANEALARHVFAANTFVE